MYACVSCEFAFKSNRSLQFKGRIQGSVRAQLLLVGPFIRRKGAVKHAENATSFMETINSNGSIRLALPL